MVYRARGSRAEMARVNTLQAETKAMWTRCEELDKTSTELRGNKEEMTGRIRELIGRWKYSGRRTVVCMSENEHSLDQD